jgi:Ser/Thr protein kinase RdoA (MazF antagonist)
MRILRAALTAVEREHPRWHARIDRLFDGCMRLAARIPEGLPCGIHRDFHPDQVLVDGDRLYVTDLDLCERRVSDTDRETSLAGGQQKGTQQ